MASTLEGGSENSPTLFNRQLQLFDPIVSANFRVRSNTFGGRLEAGYGFTLSKTGESSSRITPFAAIQPVYISQDGAYENVDKLGQGVYYAAKENTAVPIFVGVEYTGTFYTDKGDAFTPFLRASRMLNLVQPGTVSGSFDANRGISVSFDGTPNLGDAMLYRGGVKFNLGKNTTGYLNLNYERGISTSYESIGATFGLNYSM